jgi:hypothetical protein
VVLTQSIPLSWPLILAGLAVDWTFQLVPFHCSANVRNRLVVWGDSPTEMHIPGLGQAMPSKSPLLDRWFGAASTLHVVVVV